MSAIPLTDIQEILERSLFERLRLECVDKGYTPDITTFTEDAAGQLAYDAAVTAIAAGVNEFAVEVYQNSSAHAKGMKRVPRIVIVPQPFMEGALGGDSKRVYEYISQSNDYNASILPPMTTEYYFNVHLISESAKQMRILNAIMSLSIPVRGYIPFYNDTSNNFFVRKLSGYHEPQTDEGIQEAVYRFQVPDIFEVANNIVATGIAPINQITVDTKITSADGNSTTDTDDLVVTP